VTSTVLRARGLTEPFRRLPRTLELTMTTDQADAHASPEASEEEGPTCPCGHERGHFMVSPEPQYTGLDWVWVIFGITTIPYEVRFKCRRCGDVFDRTTDDALMRRYI